LPFAAGKPLGNFGSMKIEVFVDFEQNIVLRKQFLLIVKPTGQQKAGPTVAAANANSNFAIGLSGFGKCLVPFVPGVDWRGRVPANKCCQGGVAPPEDRPRCTAHN
jgi:hypothetical protein